MHSHTTPNLPLYKGLSILLGKRKIHILHKIEVLPDSSPSAGRVPAVVLPWLGSGAGVAPLKVPKEIVLCLTIRLIHPMQISPAGKSLGDLEAKHEHCTRSGGLEKTSTSPCSSCQCWSWQSSQKQHGLGAQEVLGSPPGRSSSKALQHELGTSCPMSLCCPSATLFSHPHSVQLPCLEDENKISSYFHNVLSSSNTSSLIV